MQKLIKNSDNAVIPDLLELSVQKMDGGLKHLLESSFEPIAALDDLATNLFKNGDGMGFHLLFPMNSMENARNFFAGALSVIAPRAKVSPILTLFQNKRVMKQYPTFKNI